MDIAAACLVQCALMQPLRSCIDSSHAYALQRSSENKCFLGLLVQVVQYCKGWQTVCQVQLHWCGANGALKICINACTATVIA